MDQRLEFIFDPVRMEKLADERRAHYAQAKPFPHIVMDNFLPEGVLRDVLMEFPEPKQADWIQYDDHAQSKLASKTEAQLGDNTRFLLYQFNSSVFINFLERLTSITGLIPDPHFTGGGLHQIKRGGFLKIHADFNRHPFLPLDRRLNLLLYLNEDWKEEYGGCLELWSRDMSECVVRIPPIFNRCVIFSTTDFSFHGHPDPLTCPEGQTRKSLALYYYSNGRPTEETSHGHDTLFQHRPGEAYGSLLLGQPTQSKAKQTIKKLTPPIVIDAYRYLRHKP